MAIEDKSRKRWRLPLLLFIGAFVAVVIFMAAHKRSADEPRDAVTRTAEARSPVPENRMIVSALGAANKADGVNVALQKPGPPDPVAERTAAESAARAADAAAALAESVPPPTN